MLHSKTILLVLLAFSLSIPSCSKKETAETRQELYDRFTAAMKAAEADEIGKAFNGFLSVPGGEESALHLLKRHPEEAVAALDSILSKRGNSPTKIRTLLLLAETDMAKTDPLLALKSLREFVSHIAEFGSERGWSDSAVPFDYYPVETSEKTGTIRAAHHFYFSRNDPFQSGPGSHIDNWLIRRFIALEAWEDATSEFRRIAALHTANTEKTGSPDPSSLEFAIEYSFYLKKQEKGEEAERYLTKTFLDLNMERSSHHRFGNYNAYHHSGISADEFIRLGYGAFKDADQAETLIKALQESANPASLQVLAKVESHRGDTEKALALELKYLEAKSFSPVSTEIRKGKIYANFNDHQKAVRHYEKALSLPKEDRPDVPQAPFNPHSFDVEGRVPLLGGIHPNGDIEIGETPPNYEFPPINYRSRTLEDLEKSYQALGQTENVVSTRLLIWEDNPNGLNQFERVENLAQLAASSLQGDEFRAWAEKAMPGLPPEAQANLSWALKDCEATITALEKTTNLHYFDEWLERFEGEDNGKHVVPFLTAMKKANPGEARYDLLLRKYVGGESHDEELVRLYEMDILPEAKPVFTRSNGVFDEARYADFYDLADRLMRLYHKLGRHDELEALGLRMARNEAPFTPQEKESQLINANNDESAMAFLISHSGKETLSQLDSILTDEYWPRGRKHLDWVLAGGVDADIAAFKPDEPLPSNLPDGITALVSYENVLDLAHNNENLFVGFPWGVGVYDFDGNLLRQFFLEEAALQLAAGDNELWIGTAVGLRRIELKTKQISQLWMDHERSPQDRSHRDYNLDFYNGVTGLALHGETLWIGSRQNVRKLNTRTLDLRIFSKEELNVDSHSDWEWFLIQKDGKVWANSDDGESRRYDPDTDSWETPGSSPVPNSVRLIGKIDDQIWATVLISKELGWRPGILDEKSLNVSQPVGMSPAANQASGGHLRPLSLFGKSDGRIVFGGMSPQYYLNEETHQIETLEESWKVQMELREIKLPAEFSQNEKNFRLDGSVKGYYEVALPLPHGEVVIGKKLSASPRHIYEEELWPTGPHMNEIREDSGGLHWVKNDQPARRPPPNGLAGDMVSDAAPWQNRMWLTTHAGISLATDSGHLIANFNRQEGLPGNCAFDVEELNGKFFFASHFDDHEGGLISFDPDQSVFQTITAADGLSSNAIKSLVAKNDQLEITFSPEYRRHNGGKHYLFPPTTFNPETRESPPRVEPELFVKPSRRNADHPHGKTMPFLGGLIISESTFGKKKWLLGTRGAVILPLTESDTSLTESFPQIPAKIATDPSVQLLAEARELRKDDSLSPENRMTHPNPLVVADALAKWKKSLSSDEFSIAVKKLDSPFPKLRSTAAVMLYRLNTKKSADALHKVINDPVQTIRALATLAITKHGDKLPIEGLEEIFQLGSSMGMADFGAESHFGRSLNGEAAIEAISKRGDRINEEEINFILKFPIDFHPYRNQSPVLESLGAAVLAQPELAKVLLGAKDTRRSHHTDREMARDIFQFTGPAVLPILHEALKSDDRIVRANAAMGCGAIGDQNSIKPLIAALDLESGLSKGAIVRALGDLEAREVLPLLEDLYREAQAAENQRYQSGMQFSQMAVQSEKTFRHIENLRVDWDEIKNSKENAAAPADPNKEEALLSKRIILEAVEKIGAAYAQPFYRHIAANPSDYEGRRAAATHLATADKNEREASIAALRVIASENDQFSITALVSLFLLGDEMTAQRGIQRELKKEQRGNMVVELGERVETRKTLGFAKEAIQSIQADQTQSDKVRKTASWILKGL